MSKQRRLSKIFAQDGKSVTLALDGYFFSTKTEGIDNTIKQMPELVANGLDCALVTYGMARNYQKEFKDISIVLRVDSTVNVYDNSVPDTQQVFTTEDALKIDADGMVCMTFPGAFNEEKTHAMVARLVKEAEQWNMPFIVESLPYGYPVTSPESNEAKVIADAARIAVELGADVIKTRFSGTEDDYLIVEASMVPVLALGGPKTDTLGYFKFVEHCMNMGAKGVAVGRNITQDPKPIAMVAGLNAIIHQGASPEEAYALYQNTK
ncbi:MULTISPECIES: class I fructose-bisphosphate aldolase [Providencia]|uniref:Phospho-2-dehydro-3-deoxyheptonate aldolase n=1 Tax=Providencia huashanensis TaxID=3037798 RepID=A0AA42K3B9_9GAMM|nr:MULTISPECIES: phospho-2-dehydro-3-deoxyheptonate aldolase [Providencia]MBC8654247.1 phospho-2-dehydro-3-deoxyheptonate aldolase [Providencia vermicola]HCI97768.1 phospho-2-dehydro-3-deoxyheptonate aldolase [Providencia sp.]APC10787.1 putative aldolase LsrF [Providencia rettgeri]AVL74351.1 phospho-2-dehydro-3-deoxyheptonate aldolase [Providencia rettgeri]EIL1984933.1 phospho-2-dehydro-3-deoxyheptonate aldolase [Providencia rettgeri]